MGKLISFISIGYYALRYKVSPAWLWSIAVQESNWNPDIGLHGDGRSFGLMGINLSGGAYHDYRDIVSPDLTREVFRSSYALNVKVAAWYLGVRIPQMLRAVDIKDPMAVLHAYNVGAGRITKTSSFNSYGRKVYKRANDLKYKVMAMYVGLLLIPILTTMGVSKKLRRSLKFW